MSSKTIDRFEELEFLFDEDEGIWSRNFENYSITASLDESNRIVGVMCNDNAEYNEITVDTVKELVKWIELYEF